MPRKSTRQAYIPKRPRGPQVTFADLVADGLLTTKDQIYNKKSPGPLANITRRGSSGEYLAQFREQLFNRPHCLARAFGDTSSHSWPNLICKNSGLSLFELREIYKARRRLPSSLPHNPAPSGDSAATAPQNPLQSAALPNTSLGDAQAEVSTGDSVTNTAPTDDAFALCDAFIAIVERHPFPRMPFDVTGTALLEELCSFFRLPAVYLVTNTKSKIVYARSVNAGYPSILSLPIDALSLGGLLLGFLRHAQLHGLAQDTVHLLYTASQEVNKA